MKNKSLLLCSIVTLKVLSTLKFEVSIAILLLKDMSQS